MARSKLSRRKSKKRKSVKYWAPRPKKSKSRRKSKSKSRRKSKSKGRPRDLNKYKSHRGCSRQTNKKYRTRSSPPYPANLCRDKQIRGNDGKIYMSKRQLSKGKAYYRWVKI